MQKKLVVVYGNPGAGKSYVAQILSEQFGYYSYNGDEALPSDMKKEILEKKDVTYEMRTQFVDNMINEISALSEKHDSIVAHQALIKHHMREQIRNAFPDALFLWVKCDDTILKDRYMKRAYFNLGLAYLQVMIDAFEPPDKPYHAIDNDSDGPELVIKQLESLLDTHTNG